MATKPQAVRQMQAPKYIPKAHLELGSLCRFHRSTLHPSPLCSLPKAGDLYRPGQCPHALWLGMAGGKASRRLEGRRRVKSGYFFPWLPPKRVT